METLLSRPVVIGMALTGGLLSVCATLLRRREGAGTVARRIDAVLLRAMSSLTAY